MKKDIFSELVVPYAYVQEYHSKREFKNEFVVAKKEPLGRRELVEKIINTSYNKKQKDGRIHGTDKDGNYVSHSVTPYAKKFWDNIEEKIQPLIKALKDKGYLSMSSCQGHSLMDRRFVMLIFPSKEAALQFQQNLPFKLTYNLRHATEVLNSKLDVNEYGTINNVSKQKLDNNMEQTMYYVNAFIKRNYSDAWFLDMIIVDEAKNVKGFWKKFKRFMLKKFFLEAYTKKIVKYIKEKLPINIY